MIQKIKRGRTEATFHRSNASNYKKTLGETPTLPDERALGHRDDTYLFKNSNIYFGVLRPKRKGVKECRRVHVCDSNSWMRVVFYSREHYVDSEKN